MRKLILLFLLTIISISYFVPVNGYSASEHDEYLEKVLFGDKVDNLNFSDKATKAITAIEYASYLSIDQMHSNPKSLENDEEKLKYLKNEKIPNVPILSEIDLKEIRHHRRYTHKGWDFEYGINDKAHWPIRKSLLLNTINTKLNFGFFSNKFWFDYDEKCVSFAALVYYIHILGDHKANEWGKEDYRNDMIHLADKNDKDNSLMDELEKHLKIIFEDQHESVHFKILMRKFNNIKISVYTVQNGEAGINTEEDFEVYKKGAEDLMDLLIESIPELLKNEDFFSSVFDEGKK